MAVQKARLFHLRSEEVERQAVIEELERALALAKSDPRWRGLALVMESDSGRHMRCAGRLSDPARAVYALEKMRLGLLVGTVSG